MEARPFLKWVGGKTQLLPQLLEVFPKTIRTYYEPFIGGGAIFFTLASQKRFERAIINDWNPELVNCYAVVRDAPGDLMAALDKLHYDKDLYMAQRALVPSTMTEIDRAARMIFLNKCGFNGLYRVNKSGQFNVPFGSFKTPPTLYERERILSCSEALRDVQIHHGDFEPVAGDAEQGDLVYFDPPYVPLNPTSDFTSYTSDKFGLAEQKRLADWFTVLAGRGVAVVASNSDTELVRKLYEAHDIRSVQARRNINSKGDKRGAVGEVIVIGGK